MEGDDYTPIPCATYSEYELAIMHRQRLRLRWRDEAGIDHVGMVEPLDLQTRAGAEYLLARDAAGEPCELRLDRIIDFQVE